MGAVMIEAAIAFTLLMIIMALSDDDNWPAT